MPPHTLLSSNYTKDVLLCCYILVLVFLPIYKLSTKNYQLVPLSPTYPHHTPTLDNVLELPKRAHMVIMVATVYLYGYDSNNRYSANMGERTC